LTAKDSLPLTYVQIILTLFLAFSK
jgi:hypothetical protein